MEPRAGHRSNPGPGPAPTWTLRRPAPGPAPAAPAQTAARGISPASHPRGRPLAHLPGSPQPHQGQGHGRKGSYLLSPPPASRPAHAYLQSWVEDDVPPTTASAKEDEAYCLLPASAAPAIPHPKWKGVPPRLRCPRKGPCTGPTPWAGPTLRGSAPAGGPGALGQPGQAQPSPRASSWTLTSCTRRNALLPGHPT